MSRSLYFLALAAALPLASLLLGCTPSIGDHCQLSTDCSLQGTVLCDTSQPNGYCTVFNCIPNKCQNNATCVLFDPSVQGCPYDDRVASRTGRPFCMKACSQDSDCRTDDGYVCRSPKEPPWNALILDDEQGGKVCLVPPATVMASMPEDAGVCQSSWDAGSIDAAAPAPLDAGADVVDAGAPDSGAGDAGALDAADGGGDPARRSAMSGPFGVLRAVVVRAFEATVVLLVLASLVFFAVRLLPGDPAAMVLGDQASAEDLADLHKKLHLDEPLLAQYGRFLEGLATLDLGHSIRRPGEPAMRRVGEALGPTAELAGLAVVLGAVAGVGLAVLASGPWLGKRRRWIERGFVAVAAVPLLAFAPLLTFALAARARVVPLPGDPDAGFAGLLFASTLLSIPLAAHVGRIARAALIELERAPFLTVARAKGGSAVRVWVLHAVPAAFGPIVTVVATQLGALLGGAVVLERLFERNGLGTIILEAYASRDLPVLEGAVVAAGGLFVVTQALATAAHGLVDPRAREA